jgi:hypothetical protein
MSWNAAEPGAQQAQLTMMAFELLGCSATHTDTRER